MPSAIGTDGVRPYRKARPIQIALFASRKSERGDALLLEIQTLLACTQSPSIDACREVYGQKRSAISSKTIIQSCTVISLLVL